MSFIYNNKKLIDDLVKYGQDFENRFVKNAQVSLPSPSAISSQITPQLALKLLDKIESESSTSQIIPGKIISTHSDISKDLQDSDLKDVVSLLNYLVSNKIVVNHHRVVYAFEDLDTSDKSYIPVKVNGNVIDAIRVSPKDAEYFINKDLLIDYLKSLQMIAHKDNLVLMESRVKYLISIFNQDLRLNLNTDYKSAKLPIARDSDKVAPGNQETTNDNKLPLQQINVSDVKDIVTQLPLREDNIDFVQIDGFFKSLMKILQGSQSNYIGSIESNMNIAQTNMNRIKNNTGEVLFSTSLSSSQIVQLLSRNTAPLLPSQTYKPFCDQMKQLITSTMAVVETFNIMYGNRGIFNAQELDAIKKQPRFGESNLRWIDGILSDYDRRFPPK